MTESPPVSPQRAVEPGFTNTSVPDSSVNANPGSAASSGGGGATWGPTASPQMGWSLPSLELSGGVHSGSSKPESLRSGGQGAVWSGSPSMIVSNPVDSIWSPSLGSLSAPVSSTMEPVDIPAGTPSTGTVGAVTGPGQVMLTQTDAQYVGHSTSNPINIPTQEEEARAEAVALSVVKDEGFELGPESGYGHKTDPMRMRGEHDADGGIVSNMQRLALESERVGERGDGRVALPFEKESAGANAIEHDNLPQYGGHGMPQNYLMQWNRTYGYVPSAEMGLGLGMNVNVGVVPPNYAAVAAANTPNQNPNTHAPGPAHAHAHAQAQYMGMGWSTHAQHQHQTLAAQGVPSSEHTLSLTQGHVQDRDQDLSTDHSHSGSAAIPSTGTATAGPSQVLGSDVSVSDGDGAASGEAQCFEIEFKAGRTETAWASVIDGYQPGEFAIVEADRGRDLGLVVQQVPAPEAMRPGRDGNSIKPTAGSSGRSLAELKRMLRRALPSELSQLPQKAEDEAKALVLCQQKVATRGLPMEVAEAEYQFDRRKLTFYFRADHRIDFRELIRDLFKVYKTRIWMRQIGSRSVPGNHNHSHHAHGHGHGRQHHYDPHTPHATHLPTPTPHSPQIPHHSHHEAAGDE